MKEIDGALSGSALGLGRVSSEVSTHTASTVNNQVLTADALAQAWFIYQACVLKDAGMIDDALVDSIMRQLFGLGAGVLPSVPTDTSTLDISSLAADAEAARQRSEEADRMAATASAALELGRRRRMDSASASVRGKAAADYTAIRILVEQPTQGSGPPLESFLARYSNASVTIDGVTEAVEVPEVAWVRAALARVAIQQAGMAEADIEGPLSRITKTNSDGSTRLTQRWQDVNGHIVLGRDLDLVAAPVSSSCATEVAYQRRVRTGNDVLTGGIAVALAGLGMWALDPNSEVTTNPETGETTISRNGPIGVAGLSLVLGGTLVGFGARAGIPAAGRPGSDKGYASCVAKAVGAPTSDE